jgi:hypothetical protein
MLYIFIKARVIISDILSLNVCISYLYLYPFLESAHDLPALLRHFAKFTIHTLLLTHTHSLLDNLSFLLLLSLGLDLNYLHVFSCQRYLDVVRGWPFLLYAVSNQINILWL